MQTTTAVIGAGQAGLSIAYYLKKHQRDFLLLEQANEIGASWRSRYDSLTLFTPNQYNQLPELSFPGDPKHYPNKDEVADYLKTYANYWNFPIKLNTSVQALNKSKDYFEISTNQGLVKAQEVIVATGPFQSPFIPELAKNLSTNITQLHSSAYRNPQQLPSGEVLVVGSGNSGLQIAEDLLKTHSVSLAQGKQQPELPQIVLGKSLFWWFEKLGISRVSSQSWLGKRLKSRDPVIGSKINQLKKQGLHLFGRVVASKKDAIIFSKQQSLEPKSIIWATGFKPNYSWINLPILNEQGFPRHKEGLTDVEGLYFLGLSWQRRRGSALLGWVSEDAQWLATMLLKNKRTSASHGETKSPTMPLGMR